MDSVRPPERQRWHLSHRFDPLGCEIANRHYNRQTPDSKQFAPPGKCVVLVIPRCAVWITSWQKHVKHRWPGAWVNSCFRNERRDLFLSSDLALEAICGTLYFWSPPPEGLITFIDETAVKHKRDPGRCYRKAGFEEVGRTMEENLLVLHLSQAKLLALPKLPPIGATLSLAI